MVGSPRTRTIVMAVVILLMVFLMLRFLGDSATQTIKAGLVKFDPRQHTGTAPGLNGSPQDNPSGPGVVGLSMNQSKDFKPGDNVNTSLVGLAQKPQVHPDVHVVPSYPTGPESHPLTDCVPLPSSPKPDVKICVHPTADDQWVSGIIRKGELWEGDLVFTMKAVLETDPSMQVLDLGSNIGEFSLFAAAMGRKVLAVDMLPKNVLSLQTALKLSGLSSLVTIVQNALYRDRRSFGIIQYKGNIGGTALDEQHQVSANNANNVMKSVLLDDLLPYVDVTKPAFMKLDIETSEHHAIAGGQNFLAAVDVPFIQMEWNSKPPEARKELVTILNQYGYVSSKSALHYVPIDIVNFTGNTNVYFVKKKIYEKSGEIKA